MGWVWVDAMHPLTHPQTTWRRNVEHGSVERKCSQSAILCLLPPDWACRGDSAERKNENMYEVTTVCRCLFQTSNKREHVCILLMFCSSYAATYKCASCVSSWSARVLEWRILAAGGNHVCMAREEWKVLKTMHGLQQARTPNSRYSIPWGPQAGWACGYAD